jgi:hypothetical protein
MIVHRLVPSDRVQCTVDRSEPLTRDDALLHVPMVPFEDVVHVWRPAASAVPAQIAGPFHLVASGRVRGVALNVDHARLDAPCLCNRKLEKTLRGNCIAIWRKQGNRWCCRPSRRLGTGMSTARQRECTSRRHAMNGSDSASRIESPHVQHRSVPEHPAGDGRVIHREATLGLISSGLR